MPIGSVATESEIMLKPSLTLTLAVVALLSGCEKPVHSMEDLKANPELFLELSNSCATALEDGTLSKSDFLEPSTNLAKNCLNVGLAEIEMRRAAHAAERRSARDADAAHFRGSK